MNGYNFIIFSISILCGVEIIPNHQYLYNHTISKDSLFIRYTESSGFSIYEDGDRYGHALEIYFSGEVIFYQRIYMENCEGSRIDEQELSRDTLEATVIDELQSLLYKMNFFNLSQRLPAGSPHVIEMRTPTESVAITARTSADSEPYTVRANMGADRQHYPDYFFELRGKIRQLMEQIRDKD